MNQAILIATVVQPPQTRYTPDQTAIAELTIQIPGLRDDDPPAQLKATAWGNQAQAVQELCQVGGFYVFEGSLRMETIERPEGFKKKLAEFRIGRCHPMGTPSAAPIAQAAPPPPPKVPVAVSPAVGLRAAEADYAEDIPF